MKSDPPISLVLILLSIFTFDSRAATSSERSISPSGQFIIYGGDAGSRGTISASAERTKANLLAVLKRHDDWKIAVIINLQPRVANVPELAAMKLHFSETENGLKLQLDLAISREMNLIAAERELARVILLEMIYRKQSGIVSGHAHVDPPSWLIDGLLASAPNRSHAALAVALSVPQHGISLQEFLDQHSESLDSAGKQLYRAYSFVLVQLLIGSPAGRVRLGRYIDRLAFASNDSFADLRAAFPEIRDWEKTWESEIAEIKTSSDQGLLTFFAERRKTERNREDKTSDRGRTKKNIVPGRFFANQTESGAATRSAKS